MAKPVIMPRFGMTQEEATIVRWLVNDGDFVESDDPIAEVTTDKVNMEVGAPLDGHIGGIRFQEGDTVPVTEIIAYILADGESPPEHVENLVVPTETAPSVSQEQPHSKTEASTPVARRLAEAEGISLSTVTGSGPYGKVTRKDVENHLASDDATQIVSPGKVRATPAARHLARKQNIDLKRIQGSGPGGRVQGADVHTTVLKGPSKMPYSPETGGEPLDIPIEGLRQTIATRMKTSYQEAPHITFTSEVDMSRAIEFRTLVNERYPSGPKVSMTALIIKAVAWALKKHPQLNAFVADNHVTLFPDIHLGVAVAVEDGLIVPVVHHADQKGLLRVAKELIDLTRRGREGSLLPDDVAGGTFTLSNLGMFRVDHFTAILNPPQAGILAVGRVVERVVVGDDHQPVIRPMMAITLSADHRAIDGVLAARFLDDICAALEEPAEGML